MQRDLLPCPTFSESVVQNTSTLPITEGEVLLTGKYENIAPVTNNQNIVIDLNGRHHIIVDFGEIDTASNSVEINLDAKTAGCEIGDQFIIMWKNPETGTVTLHLSSNFYFTRCGGANQDSNFTQRRLMIPFMFDGEIFCNTYDNC